MSSTSNTVSPLDGSLISFEIRDGSRRISCAVSNEALETASGLTAPSTDTLRRRSFDRFRTLINVAAELKLRTLPSGSIGTITLTSADLRCVPTETETPPFGSAARGLPRAAATVARVPVSARVKRPHATQTGASRAA